jgi:hypothetical protein
MRSYSRFVRGFGLWLACLQLLLSSNSVVRAQSQSDPSDTVAANAAYAKKDWKQATLLYERVTAADPKNGRAWYRLGVSLHQAGKNEEGYRCIAGGGAERRTQFPG